MLIILILVSRTEIVEAERGLIATAPVIFQFSRAPPLLEIRTSGITGRGIIEIP